MDIQVCMVNILPIFFQIISQSFKIDKQTFLIVQWAI